MNYMITQEDVNCEIFNSSENRIKLDGSVLQFLNYHIAILTLACSLGFISKEQSENIFNIFFGTVKQKNNNKIAITNILYVFSAWLQSMSQWDAFKELNNITDSFTANIALEKSDKWLKNEIAKLKTNLMFSRKKVLELGNENLIKVYNRLIGFLESLKNYENTQVCYKSEHSYMKDFLLWDYSFIGDDSRYKNPLKSIISRIKYMICDFVLEMNILLKLNGKDIITFFNQEKENRFLANDNNENRDEFERLAEDIFDFMIEMPNLWLAIAEFTIFSFAQKGKIKYPNSNSKRAMMIEKLNVKKGVTEVLNYSDSIGLSKSEIEYLKRFI